MVRVTARIRRDATQRFRRHRFQLHNGHSNVSLSDLLDFLVFFGRVSEGDRTPAAAGVRSRVRQTVSNWDL